MIFYFDLDDTLCFTEGVNYETAIPNYRVIHYVNNLYNENNEIVIYTARGTKTKLDWRELTEKQLKSWNVLYHRLEFGKPAWDFYIGDKCINVSDLNF